jgi:hypothetical protein
LSHQTLSRSKSFAFSQTMCGRASPRLNFVRRRLELSSPLRKADRAFSVPWERLDGISWPRKSLRMPCLSTVVCQGNGDLNLNGSGRQTLAIAPRPGSWEYFWLSPCKCPIPWFRFLGKTVLDGQSHDRKRFY